MKKKALIIVLSVLIAYFAKAQDCGSPTFTVGIDAGYSINHAATAGANFGVNFKWFNIRTGFQGHLSNKVSDGIIFETRIGHTENIGEVFYVTGQIGHAFLYRSADNKEVNKSEVLYIAEGGLKWTFKEQPMSTYISFTKAGNLYIPAIGIRGYF